MSEGDHTNDATEHTTTGEENLANQGSENVEGGEGLKAGAGAEGGDVHGDEATDEVKINEDGQKRAFGEQEEGEEDGEEYDDEEEYDDDEGKPTCAAAIFFLHPLGRYADRLSPPAHYHFAASLFLCLDSAASLFYSFIHIHSPSV